MMILEHRTMRLWSIAVVAVAVAALGCTKPNPKSCSDGSCTDPALPFCDVDGALAGDPETCIAVTCTPDEFVACRGDRAITCNGVGTDYELVQCDLGCDDLADGCRVCNANETVCKNGKVQTCDANGAVVASETCALGCFEDQPRCRNIDPSNNLGMYVDMVAAPADLDLSDAVIFTETGVVEKQGVEIQGIQSFYVPAPPNGAPIRVLVARDVRLSNVTVRTISVPGSFYTGAGLAVLATGTITTEGRVVAAAGPGAVTTASCLGGAGRVEPSNGQDLTTGSGGGGHATAGAKGGDIIARYEGGAGGGISGTETLVPLRGGCASGGYSLGQPGHYGGGAIQLSSQRSILISGVVDVRGESPTSGGGGGGGGLLIEAPTVTLGSGARLIATGGAGGAGSMRDETITLTIPTRLDDGQPEQGVSSNYQYCSRGGNGAAPGVPATAGADAPGNTSPPEIGAGGGGGGLGRIRINSRDQSYSKANTAIEAGALTTGTLSTR